MKKTILTLALASLVGVVAAQKPAAGAMGFTGGLSSLVGSPTSGPSQTGSLQFKYYVSDGLAARVGLLIKTGAGNGTTVSDTSGAGQGVAKETTTIKSGGLGWALSLGAQKSLGGTDKLDVYTGADLYFGGTTGKVTDKEEKVTKLPVPAPAPGVGVDAVGDFKKTVTTTPGSFNMGLNAFVGFQYFFVEKLAIGAEFAYGYGYSSTTGSDEVVTTGQSWGTPWTPSSTTTPKSTTVNSNDNKSTTTGGLGVQGATLTLSFFF